MIKIICGFQTGSDQAAARAAKALDIPTGGWCPRGFLTEDGPRPEFAELYGAIETPSDNYVQRTQWNVRDSDMTLWFGDPTSRGGKATMRAIDNNNKYSVIIHPDHIVIPIDFFGFIYDTPDCIINCAGNRESSRPGIGAAAERFFGKLFSILKEALNA